MLERPVITLGSARKRRDGLVTNGIGASAGYGDHPLQRLRRRVELAEERVRQLDHLGTIT